MDRKTIKIYVPAVLFTLTAIACSDLEPRGQWRFYQVWGEKGAAAAACLNDKYTQESICGGGAMRWDGRFQTTDWLSHYPAYPPYMNR